MTSPSGNFTNLTASNVSASGFVSASILTSDKLSNGLGVDSNGNYSHAEGYLAQAIGIYSHAEGRSTITSGEQSHAEGYLSKTYGNNSHAEGSSTEASGSASHAEGAGTVASGSASHAEGYLTVARGLASHAEGSSSLASGIASHAEGLSTTASADYSHAEGSGSITGWDYTGVPEVGFASASHAEGILTRTYGVGSHAEGSNTYTIGIASHAEGNLTTASGISSHAEGQSTRAIGQYSHAEGNNTTANGNYSHAEGSGSIAGFTFGMESALLQGVASHAEGILTMTRGTGSHSEGMRSYASGSYSHAEGQETTSSGQGSHAEGSSSLASGIGSHAEGRYTTASAYYSHAEGEETIASGQSSHAEGKQTHASGSNSHAEGSSSLASGSFSHAEGLSSISRGSGSHAEGFTVVAHGHYSHAEGYTSLASGSASHAEGGSTVASGIYAHAEGVSSWASGSASHAEGSVTTASGHYSHAEGYASISRGEYSHAEGNATLASGSYSHAEGNATLASGSYSHAEGNATLVSGDVAHAEGSETVAIGNYSHAEGGGSVSQGLGSHAEGSYTNTLGNYSHAEGQSTTASADYQHVSGKYNVASANSNDLFIIGNGTAVGSRSNIVVVNTSSVIVSGNISSSGFSALNITASNISASGYVTLLGDLTASNILINGGSINKVEKFLGLNTSSFGTGTLTNERSKTTDDVIYTSASVNYLLHVHHNSASLQIYNLQTRNLVSNVSLTSGKNPNSIYLEGNKAFVGCYGSGSIAIVDISNINSPTTTYASSLGATSYTDDNNFVDPIVFGGNFIFGNISSLKIYNTSSVTFVSSTGVGTRITALHAYTSASVDVLLVLGYGSAGSAGTAFLFAYNITTPSAPVLMSQAPVLNTVLQPLPTAAERFCALTVDHENKYAYVGDSTSNVDDTILRVFDLSDLNFIKTIAEVKLNNGYYPFGTPVINRVSLTSYNTVLVTDTNNKRTFEFDLYDIKKQNGQLVVPIKIYTFNDTPTSVKFFKQQLSEDVIVVSTLNGNISFQNKSNKFIINSVNSDGTDSKNSILSLNNFTANISGSLIVSDNINCKTTINASELQFPNHSKIKSDSNYIRTLSSNHVIISEPTLSYNAAFYDYCVYSGSNIRAGVIAAAFSAGTVSYNETTTADIGNTSQLTMSVAFSGDFIQLLSNASTNVSWSIKAMARYI